MKLELCSSIPRRGVLRLSKPYQKPTLPSEFICVILDFISVGSMQGTHLFSRDLSFSKRPIFFQETHIFPRDPSSATEPIHLVQ